MKAIKKHTNANNLRKWQFKSVDCSNNCSVSEKNALKIQFRLKVCFNFSPEFINFFMIATDKVLLLKRVINNIK